MDLSMIVPVTFVLSVHYASTGIHDQTIYRGKHALVGTKDTLLLTVYDQTCSSPSCRQRQR